VGIVALNTFREAVRDRVLYNLVFFALLMMLAAVVVGKFRSGFEESGDRKPGRARFVIGLADLGFIGVALVSKEMESGRCTRAGEAGAALGVSAGKIRRAGADARAVNTGGDGRGAFLVMLYVKHSLQREDAVVLVACTLSG